MLDIDDCLTQATAVPGALGASLIDCTTGRTVRSAGRNPHDSPELTGAGAAAMVSAIVHHPAFAPVGRPGQVDDVVITSATGFHLIQFMPDARLVLYLWLAPDTGNVALSKRALQAIADEFAPARLPRRSPRAASAPPSPVPDALPVPTGILLRVRQGLQDLT